MGAAGTADSLGRQAVTTARVMVAAEMAAGVLTMVAGMAALARGRLPGLFSACKEEGQIL